MFLSLDGTFWIQLINFAIFYAILNVVFLRPVGEAIRKRRAYIDSVRSDLERYVREARDLRAQADARRADARRAAGEAFAAARTQATAEADAISAGYTAQAAEIARSARATVASELEQAHQREPELARALAGALLDRAIGVVTR
jgi:F0F1-type ATP synthase membrane subunit b/b'